MSALNDTLQAPIYQNHKNNKITFNTIQGPVHPLVIGSASGLTVSNNLFIDGCCYPYVNNVSCWTSDIAELFFRAWGDVERNQQEAISWTQVVLQVLDCVSPSETVMQSMCLWMWMQIMGCLRDALLAWRTWLRSMTNRQSGWQSSISCRMTCGTKVEGKVSSSLPPTQQPQPSVPTISLPTMLPARSMATTWAHMLKGLVPPPSKSPSI